METVHQMIEESRNELISTLQRWIGVPSVKSDATEGAPFGAEVARALDMALNDAKNMGFAVRNFDHYAGDVRMVQSRRRLGLAEESFVALAAAHQSLLRHLDGH